jgi:hypothetical protein
MITMELWDIRTTGLPQDNRSRYPAVLPHNNWKGSRNLQAIPRLMEDLQLALDNPQCELEEEEEEALRARLSSIRRVTKERAQTSKKFETHVLQCGVDYARSLYAEIKDKEANAKEDKSKEAKEAKIKAKAKKAEAKKAKGTTGRKRCVFHFSAAGKSRCCVPSIIIHHG